MQNTIKTILGARRKRFLQSKPIFHFHEPTSEMDLFIIARKMGFKFTLGLSQWLRAAGYGDINETLIFRADYFATIENGSLTGYITFARDELGNSYAFDPEKDDIYFIGTQGVYARMADNFPAFLQELIHRDYNLVEWRTHLALTPLRNAG